MTALGNFAPATLRTMPVYPHDLNEVYTALEGHGRVLQLNFVDQQIGDWLVYLTYTLNAPQRPDPVVTFLNRVDAAGDAE